MPTFGNNGVNDKLAKFANSDSESLRGLERRPQPGPSVDGHDTTRMEVTTTTTISMTTNNGRISSRATSSSTLP